MKEGSREFQTDSVVAVAVGRSAYGSPACFLNGGLALKSIPGSPGGVNELHRQTGLNLAV